MLKISAFSLMLTRENTDFSTHLMEYIWYSPKRVNIPYILYGLQKMFGFSDLLGFWHDILLPQLVCGQMKGQSYMCHKKKKKKKKNTK